MKNIKNTKFTKARLKINPNISELAVEVFFHSFIL